MEKKKGEAVLWVVVLFFVQDTLRFYLQANDWSITYTCVSLQSVKMFNKKKKKSYQSLLKWSSYRNTKFKYVM